MRFTDGVIRAIPTPDKTRDYTTDEIPGFRLQVTPKGTKTFYLVYTTTAGKRGRYKIGRWQVDLPTSKAKRRAIELRGQVAAGRDPGEEKKTSRRDHVKDKATKAKRKGLVMRAFLDDRYLPWVDAEHKAAGRTRQILESFTLFHDRYLDDITSWEIEKWRAARRKAGRKPSTVKRQLTALKAMFNKAIAWGLLETNPVGAVKKRGEKEESVIRYLSDDERVRLLTALEIRTDQSRHLKPFILTLMNTGARPGELFSLRRDAVDLERRSITLHGAYTKSGMTRYVPLNDTAHAALEGWLEEARESEWVFPGMTGSGHLVSIQKAWGKLLADAKITKFRLYDLRHEAATKLVEAGVSLYEVAEILGHANINQTKVYAHIKPDNLRKALDKIG